MKKAFVLLTLLLAASVAVNVWQAVRHDPVPSVVVERDTVWRDSIIREPIPVETINTGRVVYVRIPAMYWRQPADSVSDTGDCLPDSIEVPVPITQKRYDDSLYTAWVSGYEPALDSLRLHLPEVTATVTKTILKPSPTITVGVQAGGGYGIFHRQADIYIGFGVQLNLWRK